MTVKTLEEMLDYAKNIVDTDVNAFILFLFQNRQDMGQYKSIMSVQNKYVGLGTLTFGVIPEDWESARSTYSGVQCTHIFVHGFPKSDVKGLLRARCKSYKHTREPSGFYTPTHIERVEYW